MQNVTKEGMSTMKRCLFQIVYPIIECADLMAAEALNSLQKESIYKFNLKRLSISGRKKIANAVKRCQVDCDVDFIEEYAARIEDKIYPDIVAIRDSFFKIMQENGYKHAYAMCRFEVTSVLLQIAVMAYKGVSDNDFKRTGLKYFLMFKEYNVVDVYKEWNKIGDEFYKLTLEKNFNLNNYQEPKELLDKFYKDLFDNNLMTDILNSLVKEYK